MYRNSPVRNPRAKGIKVKNVLQVCLLVAVCFWLIFQLKRSHDKRKEFDASDGKVSLSTVGRSGEGIAKLGRKDLQPKLEKTGNDGEGDGREQEEEEVQDERDEVEDKREEEEQDEHDENKREEEEQDEDKIEEEKDDGRDDEIDENEQEKSDVEIDREEVDVVGEEKETEESDEKENENENEDVSEEKDGQSQTENEVSSVENNEEGDTEHTHEAREENYKADDASSAVTHTGRTLGTENEIKNGTIVALSENVGQTAENGTSTSTNTTVIQEKDPEPLISDVNPASSINSSENGPPSDTTLITTQSTETQNITEVTEASSNSTEISNSEVTESIGSISDPAKTELETETNNVTEVTEVTEETVDPDEVQHDPIDSTDLTHLEEKDVRTDLDTLPDIVTEGGNSEDTAAE